MAKKTEASDQKKRVAIYCRVSTFDQAKGEFTSLNSQEMDLRKYAQQQGWEVIGVYSDTASGSTVDRPELTRLLSDATSHKFDVIAITKLDRMSRSLKDFLGLDETFRKAGIDVAVTTQNIDTTTPAGKLQRTIMIAFAEFEREMGQERTRESLWNRAKSGYWLGGNVLLGYDVEKKKLVVNDQEASVVKKIYQYYLDEPSTNKVAMRLNSEGYRTKIRMTKGGKNVGGKEFNNQHVHDILKNKTYTGYVKFKGEEFRGLHVPIIDQALFDKVQARLQESKLDRHATYDKSELLLLGLTKCGFCDSGLTTSYAKDLGDKLHFYYKCTTKSKLGASKCDSRDLPAAKLEAVVEKAIMLIAAEDAFFNAAYIQIIQNDSVDLEDLKTNRDSLTRNLAQIKKEQNSLVNFIAKAGTAIEVQPITDKLSELNRQRDQVEESLKNVAGKIDLIEAQKISKSTLRKHYNKIAQFYPGMDNKKKRALITALILWIKCKVKKKEKKGTLELAFRGDGISTQEWGLDEDPQKIASSLHVDWLLGQDSNLQPIG